MNRKIEKTSKTSHNFLRSFQSEGEALGTCQQHRDVRRGGRGVRAVEQSEPVSSLHRHDHRRVRGPAGGRLPQVVPPLEDHPSRGECSPSVSLVVSQIDHPLHFNTQKTDIYSTSSSSMLVLTHFSKAPDNWESQMGDEETEREEVDDVEQVPTFSQSLI